MSLADWRAKRRMRDPVRGVLRVTGFDDQHPGSPPGMRITGMLVAPGIPATPAEHEVDAPGRRPARGELPVLIDRSDPSRFTILWSEVTKVSPGDQARLGAEAEADLLDAEEHF
jgi:hypothetical protein